MNNKRQGIALIFQSVAACLSACNCSQHHCYYHSPACSLSLKEHLHSDSSTISIRDVSCVIGRTVLRADV